MLFVYSRLLHLWSYVWRIKTVWFIVDAYLSAVVLCILFPFYLLLVIVCRSPRMHGNFSKSTFVSFCNKLQLFKMQKNVRFVLAANSPCRNVQFIRVVFFPFSRNRKPDNEIPEPLNNNQTFEQNEHVGQKSSVRSVYTQCSQFQKNHSNWRPFHRKILRLSRSCTVHGKWHVSEHFYADFHYSCVDYKKFSFFSVLDWSLRSLFVVGASNLHKLYLWCNSETWESV